MKRLYGLMAAFETPEGLITAARRAREAGYRRMDAFTPFHVPELDDLLEVRDHRVPLFTLIGGILGGVGGFSLQLFGNGYNYPLNIGGRPLNSWPAFIPVTFELTILAASLTAFFGLMWLNGFPRPHHPVFSATCFDLASLDRFFLCIEAADPHFEAEGTRRFLEEQNATEVSDVVP